MIPYSICLWLLLLGIMPSKTTHGVVNGKMLFFLKAEQYSSVCMYVDVYTPPLPHPSSVHGHLACFRVSAIVNSAAMDVGGHVSF